MHNLFNLICDSVIDVVLDSVSGSSMSSNGFVTFDDLATAACAARAPLSHDHNNFKASLAPDPRDIRWECAHINDSYSKGREWTVSDGSHYRLRFHLQSFAFSNILLLCNTRLLQGKLLFDDWSNSMVYTNCQYSSTSDC